MDRRRLLKASALLAGGALISTPALSKSRSAAPFAMFRVGKVERSEQAKLSIQHASGAAVTDPSEFATRRVSLRLNRGKADQQRLIWSMQSMPVLNVGRPVTQLVSGSEPVVLQLDCKCRLPYRYDGQATYPLQRGSAYLLVGPDSAGRQLSAYRAQELIDCCAAPGDESVHATLAQFPAETVWLSLS